MNEEGGSRAGCEVALRNWAHQASSKRDVLIEGYRAGGFATVASREMSTFPSRGHGTSLGYLNLQQNILNFWLLSSTTPKQRPRPIHSFPI